MLVRGVEAEVLPTCQKYGMGVIPWSPLGGGWLSGRWRKGEQGLSSRRSERLPQRYDLSIPANQAKLEAATALGDLASEAGISLIHMALAFVIGHPAVTSAIIGPRTQEHLDGQVGAAELSLEPGILDRIDQIVKPGTNFSWADAGYEPPAVAQTWRRRRPPRY
jgi:aryl-alcohol dehydrogenase-like predicted oxidoreductase